MTTAAAPRSLYAGAAGAGYPIRRLQTDTPGAGYPIPGPPAGDIYYLAPPRAEASFSSRDQGAPGVTASFNWTPCRY
jgi:hypothetical protein